MKNAWLPALSIVSVIFSASQICAQDLSTYRGFHVGMGIAAVATQTEVNPEPRVVLQRPALIQELTWQAQRWQHSTGADSIKKIQFSFYNDHLFRMVVRYDRDKTEGLTTEDIVAALSATYGLPLLSTAQPMPSTTTETPASPGLEYDDKVLARWGDSENSIDLVQSPYQAEFGLVVRSKSIDALAHAAMAEGARLDAEEAPQREIERQQKAADAKRVKNDLARQANKQTFRP